jgi:steroid 5-alpha reductase family enzyme
LGREIVRQQVPKAVFHVFNWTFISFIQSILLFLIAAPVYTILLASTIEPNLTSADLASVAIELGLILTEYIADEQQWGKPPCLTQNQTSTNHSNNPQPTNQQRNTTKTPPR